DDDQQDRHRDPDQPGQPGVLPDGHDDSADGHDRHHDHEVQRHESDHLDLLNVVRPARDQGGGAELRHVLSAEGIHAAENIPADVPAQAHRGVSAEPHGHHRGEELNESDGQHDAARGPDVADIPGGYAVVDDPRIQGGKVEHRQGSGQLENDDSHHVPAVGGDVPLDE